MPKYEKSSEKGYNPGMPSKLQNRIDQSFPSLIGYLAILAVAILGFQFFDAGFQRVFGVALLAAFTILFAAMPGKSTEAWQRHLCMLVMTGIVVILLFMQPTGGVFPMLFFVLSPTAMMIFEQRTGMAWIGIFTLVTAIVFMIASPFMDALILTLPYSAGYWFFGAFARALATAETARQESQQLLTELQTAHRQLQEYAAQVEELAVAEERNRLSREMHDTIGHRLTVSAVQLEGAQRLIQRDPKRASDIVGTVREQVRAALSELRSAVATLREPLETDLPLTTALRRLAASFESATGLAVDLDLPAMVPALTNAQRLALYRAAQEALTNVQRHARAQQVWLQLQIQESCLSLTIYDDGAGFPAETKETAFGLRGMRERAAHLNGEVRLENRAEGGAQMQFLLPLVEESEDDRNDSVAACR